MKKDNKQRLFEVMQRVDPDFAEITEASNNPNRLDPTLRKKVNKELRELGDYHPEIPLDKIEDILEKYGIVLLQEDYTKWSGFLLGEESNTYIEIGYINTARQENDITFYTPIINSKLSLSWYKMQGRYEVISYLT